MEIIRNILEELHPEYHYTESENFIEDGFLDSFDMVTLIAELEERFHVTIDALDIVPENFISVETIAKMVQKNGGTI